MHSEVLAGQFTEEEFLALPESHDRIELLDGEVLLSPPPPYVHQRVVLRLGAMLQSWADRHPPAAVGLAPLDVRLAPGRVVQPDVFVAVAGLDVGSTGPIAACPDFVVEVLSSNRSYDRMTKRLVYAEAGVREYWIVDAAAQSIEQLQGIETVATISTGSLKALSLQDFQCNLAELFR